MIKAHKIRINPTAEQEEFLWRCAGVARFVFNRGLAQWKTEYEAGLKPTALSLRKEFNVVKREECPFVMEVPKDVAEGAFSDLGRAFKNFFDSVTGKRSDKVGYPRFKSRKRSKPSFKVNNDKFRVDGHTLKLPKLKTLVNMVEPLRFDGKIMSGTVSFYAGHWYISIVIKMEKAEPVKHSLESVGIDLGLKTLATLSDGTIFENQKVLRSELRKLKKLNRQLARRQQGSNRWHKAKAKLQKLHARVANRRADIIHKMTHKIAKTYALIGIEDLHVKGMIRNRRLALSVADAAMGEVVRQLEYKCKWFGGKAQKVGRFYASSKLCSDCGHKNDQLVLSDRRWACAGCGTIRDRDFNASENIEQEALRLAFA
ncbi:MAG: RNA-guided endonuclease TnpB family protein [Chloroflexota bacterium]